MQTIENGQTVPATPPYRVHLMAPGASKPTVTMRCPVCQHIGTLEASELQDMREGLVRSPPIFVVRRCPNVTCHAVIFAICDVDGEIAVSYPPETIDFDASNLPEGVLSALEEAIACHGVGAYRAGAVMVRRTLEEVCADQQVVGDNLYQRIEALSSKVALPTGFLEGLHDLRLLGNDAVHIELKDFDAIDKEAAEIAIDMTKLLLQPLYQYQSTMQRLAAKKKQSGTPS